MQAISSSKNKKMQCKTKQTSEQPLLIASIPTEPVPLYKSNHRPGLSEAGLPPADCTPYFTKHIQKHQKKPSSRK